MKLTNWQSVGANVQPALKDKWLEGLTANQRDPGSIPQSDIGSRLVGKRKALKACLGLPVHSLSWARNTLAKDLTTQHCSALDIVDNNIALEHDCTQGLICPAVQDIAIVDIINTLSSQYQ